MPDDRRKPIIIYDGECPFCLRQVERIQRWSRPGTFEYLPFQETTPEEWPQLHREGLEAGLRVVEPDGATHLAYDAVHAIARRLPRVRRLAWLLRLPGVYCLGSKGYQWVARHRGKLGCIKDCRR